MRLEKRNTLTNDVLFIDGLWGTGKSLLGPVISGMNGVEKAKIENIYENISWLFQLGKIDKDAAVWMLRTYADAGQYHNTIGREINLRWGDDTGLKNSPDKLVLLGRLFGEEGDGKIDEINRENLAFCVMSHMLMLAPELLFEAYGERVKVIEMLRHPLYMVHHFEAYLSRYESPREFTISTYHDETKVPWFAHEWEEIFVNCNSVEQAVLCITRLYPWLNQKIESYQNRGLAVLDLSFEEAVFDTSQMLDKLQRFTGRAHHSSISKILKKQKLPRDTIAKGKGHASYGWSNDSLSEAEDYQKMLNKVKKGCSNQLLEQLEKTIAWYNEKYPSKLSELA